ncbi:hypothetical protein FNJ84_06005 [Paracoccus sp. M683]|uniref:hypothetical protein n=1 Tax=Paracoccus sp. M683 TaxID=2594268 RepID=UPI00117CAC4A|nr:hypothetical protein [Paracoccus sp. M683]TRW98330.1 hypothetical protein FNJ84_06005 [Paracoccus sp. M683]
MEDLNTPPLTEVPAWAETLIDSLNAALANDPDTQELIEWYVQFDNPSPALEEAFNETLSVSVNQGIADGIYDDFMSHARIIQISQGEDWEAIFSSNAAIF